MEERKADHIEMAFRSQVSKEELDSRFRYEPVMAPHEVDVRKKTFLDKQIGLPIWVSSMTGGTEKAYGINQNLAKACAEFGMGMGLGSCRPLLESDQRLRDFDLRSIIGEKLPFYANLGIAQIEHLLTEGKQEEISQLVSLLNANGLIVHVNPMQEWLQPEGDRFKQSPINTIKDLLSALPDLPIIVKEVGQGMGPDSLKALMKLPLHAIDFAASGGTNFALLELLRSEQDQMKHYESLSRIGHSAKEMVGFVNNISRELAGNQKCDQFIISGGVKNFLDGYYYMGLMKQNCVYGQASALLQYAQESYQELREYLTSQSKGLAIARAYLRVNQDA